MHKFHYVFAGLTFVDFFILLMTYETDAIKAFDQAASDFLFGIDFFHLSTI